MIGMKMIDTGMIEGMIGTEGTGTKRSSSTNSTVRQGSAMGWDETGIRDEFWKTGMGP